jgi:hypothetical protein
VPVEAAQMQSPNLKVTTNFVEERWRPKLKLVENDMNSALKLIIINQTSKERQKNQQY